MNISDQACQAFDQISQHRGTGASLQVHRFGHKPVQIAGIGDFPSK
jgi:hypothetical protein